MCAATLKIFTGLSVNGSEAQAQFCMNPANKTDGPAVTEQ
jgi:hypothetical protein